MSGSSLRPLVAVVNLTAAEEEVRSSSVNSGSIFGGMVDRLNKQRPIIEEAVCDQRDTKIFVLLSLAS